MNQNPYPYLGFNPVPGAPSDVEVLRGQIGTAADAVKETNQLLNRLRNSNDNVWKGEGGDAFRAHFDATLAQDLGYAQNSLERAVGLLSEWNTNLVSFQETAKGLETEAAEAKGQYNTALQTLQQARSNSDLGLGSMTFTDPVELQAAQTRLNAANAQVTAATTAVNTWQGNIDSIIRRAHELESNHDSLARRIATELDAAAKDFAPSPPDKSIWDRITDAVKAVGEWIDEHREGLHELLADTAAIAGLLAVITPPPIDAIALGVSLVAGAGALALDLTDTDMRNALIHGSWSDKLDAAKTIGGDALGLVPGIGALSKVGKVALLGDALGDAGRLEGMARAWGEAAHNPGFVNKFITDKNIGNVTNALNSTGITNGTNKLLQLTGVEGSHSIPDPATALKVFKSAKKSITGLGEWGYEQVTGD